jgi:hypothetical protein
MTAVAFTALGNRRVPGVGHWKRGACCWGHAPCRSYLYTQPKVQEVEIESVRKMLARAADTEHSNWHISLRAARPSERASAVMALIVRK